MIEVEGSIGDAVPDTAAFASFTPLYAGRGRGRGFTVSLPGSPGGPKLESMEVLWIVDLVTERSVNKDMSVVPVKEMEGSMVSMVVSTLPVNRGTPPNILGEPTISWAHTLRLLSRWPVPARIWYIGHFKFQLSLSLAIFYDLIFATARNHHQFEICVVFADKTN